MAVVFKNGVSLPVPCPIGVHFGDRRWCGGPANTEVVIADVDGAAWRIGDRIVGPWGEAMALTVAAPREAGTGFGNERAKVRVGHDIDPRRRRPRPRTEINGIFLRVLGKAAKPIEIL